MSESNAATESDANRNAPIYLGIDLGGTSIKLALVREEKIVALEQVLTKDFLGPREVFEFALSFAKRQIETLGYQFDQLQAAGLAAPGVLAPDVDELREVANLSAWTNVSLTDVATRILEKPVVLLNDANAAALAEYKARDLDGRSLALVTLGTGIGCGLLLNGVPHCGDSGIGGELGHVVIDAADHAWLCGCGKRGHVEAYAGAGGVVRIAKEMLRDNPGSVLHQDIDDLSPYLIAQAAEQGDATAVEIVCQTARYVGHAVSILCHIADPSYVLFGGAMDFGGPESTVGLRFLDVVRQTVVKQSLVQVGEHLHIEFATLGKDAGVIGAALFAEQARETSSEAWDAASSSLLKNTTSFAEQGT
ncbi:ROK family protein [Rubripirellula amarantea]|nr:ROK family protein [Rubripirellula amarantea]